MTPPFPKKELTYDDSAVRISWFSTQRRGQFEMAMSKGEIEAEISRAIVEFEKEYMGRGPDETRTYLLDDMVVVRLHRVLTLAEKQLARADEGARGRALVKQVRTELLEKARPLLDKTITDITGRKVVSLHTDISTVTGERIIVFTLGESIPGGRIV